MRVVASAVLWATSSAPFALTIAPIATRRSIGEMLVVGAERCGRRHCRRTEQGRDHRRSMNLSATYDRRTNDVESSVVASGDLWRAEASHSSRSAAPRGDGAPLFLIQLGPVLFVRDTTLLFPVHLSERHFIWYGFERKNGVHSVCPAYWSAHRRWFFMSMICLNPFACNRSGGSVIPTVQWPDKSLTGDSPSIVRNRQGVARTTAGLGQPKQFWLNIGFLWYFRPSFHEIFWLGLGPLPGGPRPNSAPRKRCGLMLQPALQFTQIT